MEQPELQEDQAPEADQPIAPDQFIAMVTQSENLAAEMDDHELELIGRDAVDDFDLDKESMSDWLEKMEKAIDLANLVKEEKTYPFKSASNIKYPLVTSAALQFNARAYPAIVSPTDLVKTKIWGGDPQGIKAAKGKRASSYMSWQLLSEVEEWDQETDKLLVQLPIVGDMFRRVWHDGERARCKLIDPGKFVVNIKAQNISDAPRCSEELSLYPHEIKERITDGRFVDFEYDEDSDDDQAAQDFIEMHTRLDLDKDGYREPYIVVVHRERQTVVRLVADFEPEDVRFKTETKPVPAMVQTETGMVETVQMQEVPTGIKEIRRNTYFVHYQFMPGMGEGMLGTGLGILLGDISAAVNSSINMMMDAGHYASLGGGFIGSEFRIKGGNKRMRPGEYMMVSATGDDIRKGLIDRTFPGPDTVMFQMLGLLMEAGKEISSTKDIMTGDAGSKTMTATATMALIEQGMKVFTAAYKRIFRSLKREFKMFAVINATTLDPEKYSAFHDEPANPQEDFDLTGMDIEPVADPNAVTKTQEMARAQLLMEMSQQGLVNPQVAALRILEAASIDDVEELLPQPDPMQEQMTMMGMAAAEADLTMKRVSIEKVIAEIESERASAAETWAGIELEEKQQRFDVLLAMMEDSRKNVDQAIAAASAGMARKPGDGSNPAGALPAIVGPQEVNVSGVLGGQAPV